MGQQRQVYLDGIQQLTKDGNEYYLINFGGYTGLYVPDGLGALRRARRADLPPNATYNYFKSWDLCVYSEQYNQWTPIEVEVRKWST